ncbi:hypothetical protein STENM327S_07811 [Streptomyces tendae]
MGLLQVVWVVCSASGGSTASRAWVTLLEQGIPFHQDERGMPGDRGLIDQQRPSRSEVLRHEPVTGRQPGVERGEVSRTGVVGSLPAVASR